MALKIASTGPLPSCLLGHVLAVDVELHGGALRAPRAGDDGQRDQPDAVVRRGDLLVDQRLDVLVVDVLLAVGELLEADEGVLELVVAELVAQLLQLACGRRRGPNACP